MDEGRLIHWLLYRVFIDLRLEGHEKKNAKVFHIADLFHNTPLKINSGKSAAEIMAWLRSRAEEKGMASWLDDAISEVEQWERNAEARVEKPSE